MSVSVWSRSSSPHQIRAEVAILGAGIAGISAALHLQDRGISATVIERRAIASGASSRNAGFLMRGAADNYAAGIRELGREKTQRLWKLSEDNLTGLIARGADSLPTFGRRQSCLLATSEDEACELQKSAQLMKEDGFAVELKWKDTDAPWQNPVVRCGLVNPHDGVVNPVHLVRHLASQLRNPVIEQAEVAEVDVSGNDIVIRCANIVVTAPRMVVCMNAFVGTLFPQIAHWAKPNRGQILAMRVPVAAAPIRCAYYANHGYDYFRRIDDETVIFGGRRDRHEPNERTESDAPTAEVQASLEQLAREMLGHKAPEYPVVARWAGTMGFSPTMLPIIAPIPMRSTGGTDPDSRVVFCGGFTGHGMSLGYETARCAVEFMLDGTPPPFPRAPGV